MKTTFFLLFTLLIGHQSFSQELECKDFKEGTFVITSKLFPGAEFTIERTNEEQREFPSKVPEAYKDYPKRSLYSSITWINECSYKLIYIAKKDSLDTSQIYLNKNGGITAKLIPQKGKCFQYSSEFTINNTKFDDQGTICKTK